jgi:L-serine dehydratase
MSYHTLKEICDICRDEKKEFWQVIRDNDCCERQVEEDESLRQMMHMYEAMLSSDAAYDTTKRSASGLSGGDGGRFAEYAASGQSLCGEFLGRVVSRAIRVAETNACMGRIVAAPTAGSCGVLPAVIISFQERSGIDNETCAKALFTAGGIGQIIAEKASLSGAECGCQAEIGSAAAMAAGAITYLRGGTPEQICDASAIALKDFLGLTCDPVGGLVEVPCIKRNAAAAEVSILACDMVMAGIRSYIPADEVIEAMNEIGRDMSDKFRETALGGLAATDTGRNMKKNL